MSGMDGMPIIKLEIQGMKHTVMVALSEHHARISEEVQHALEQACSESNIRTIVALQVNAEVRKVMKEEIHYYFSIGEGRDAIREMARQRLSAAIADAAREDDDDVSG